MNLRRTAPLVFVVLLAGTARAATVRSSSVDPAITASQPIALAELDRTIRALERQTSMTPTSSGLDLLAQAQLRRGRLTGDATSYARAEATIRKSLRVAPRNKAARLLDAEIRYTNHDFSGARNIATELTTERPTDAAALAILHDAQRELGEYDAARLSVERLESLEPTSPAVTVRRARLSFLLGDANRAATFATRAERQAADSGLRGSDRAFYASFRAQLALDRGDHAAAKSLFRNALTYAPGDRSAIFGLAKSLAAAGEEREAIRILTPLVDRLPDPVFLSLLGALHRTEGSNAKADEIDELVAATAAIAESNKQVYDRALTRHYNDRNIESAKALRLARAERVGRADIYADDTLAWAEFRAGNLDAAATAATQALRFSTPDASVHYHAGMIAAARGERTKAIALLDRALSLDSAFDPIHAPLALSTLKDLRAS